MAEEQTEPTEIQVQVARGRPLTGAILGTLIGLALAVLLQQQGFWPLDKITVFLLPAVIGVIGLVLLSVKRVGAPGPMIVAFIILIPMAAWGATGLGTINEVGQLNGGCEVQAQTSVPDTTNVTDTSKQDPFLIDPNGGLKWAATSPVVFDDYPWRIWVEIGGAQITLDSETSQNNDGGSQINGGDVGNVTEYAASRGIDVSQLRGVYKVGGDAAGTCDGFGFVKLIAEPLETIIAKIAAALAALLTILLLIIAFTGRTRPIEAPVDVAGGETANGGGTASAADAGGAAAAGTADAGASASAPSEDNDSDGGERGNTVEGSEPGVEDLPDRDNLA